jgi:hypothetical protein
MLRPSLDHNINGVLEIAPKRWDKALIHSLNFVRRLCHDKALLHSFLPEKVAPF